MTSSFNSQPSTDPEVVIRVENLYKEYRLGTISHGTLYRDLQSWWARIRGKEDPNSIISHQPSTGVSNQPSTLNLQPSPASTLNPQPSGDNPHFLALNDVSFEVKRGEVLGIIGRNGAGKSTLLKILSEVTSPTKGTVKIKGRVASLLEVGTGFHPELTGRENIYLNGAILGMTKKEITNKFDEIVAFAEIEKFIDTPVKRYSSGMYVRLAFAVAAYLEPEILIVDEVLAVGDAQFQKKCLGKMGEVAKGGRTVLFVSHNMQAVSALCSKAIVLDKGHLVLEATPETAIRRYLDGESGEQGASVEWSIDNAPGNDTVRLTRVAVLNERGDVSRYFDRNEPILLWLEYVVLTKQRYPIAAQVRIFDQSRTCVFMSSKPHEWANEKDNCTYKSNCVIPPNLMNDGRYYLDVHFTTPNYRVTHLQLEGIVSFEVNDSQRESNFGSIPGSVRPNLFWSTEIIG